MPAAAGAFSGAGDLKKVGRIGLKSVIYFEVLTTLALVIGLVFAFSSGIGSGANIHLDQLSSADANGLAFIAATWGYGSLQPAHMAPHWRAASSPQALAATLMCT